MASESTLNPLGHAGPSFLSAHSGVAIVVTETAELADFALGYEAAHPALQMAHWADDVGEL